MRKRKFGDRSDGWRLRGLDPYDTVSPYIMVERNGSSNFFADKIEISEIEKYIKEKKAAGLTNFGVLHIFIAAYVRTISQKPFLNRFINGQKVFARNCIEVNMAIKPKMERESTDTVVKIDFEAKDTATDVYNKFMVVYNKATSDANKGFDDTAKIINYVPGLFKKFVVWLLKLLDYFGLLPRFLTKVSPFHGSMFITSMGSLGIPPIYHHLYDFGNVPVFISFGAMRHVYELDSEGQVQRKKYIDYAVVTDERICDGFSYSSAFKMFKKYMANPWLLDAEPEQILEDSNIDKATSPKALLRKEKKLAKKNKQ